MTAPKRHPLSEQFHGLLVQMGEMHDRKQADYGSDADPFANVRAASEWGLPGWVGAMVRVNDKVRRLQAFARKGELSNESAEDSFMDIAVYSIIALCLYLEESACTATGDGSGVALPPAEDSVRIAPERVSPAPDWHSRGRCGHHADGVGRCELTEGHQGAHEVGHGTGKTTWGPR